MNNARYFAPCPRGLEPLLAEDVAAAGARDIRQVPGGVHFGGHQETCYRVNLESRIATRVVGVEADTNGAELRLAGGNSVAASAM